jgi:hypothetical protein
MNDGKELGEGDLYPVQFPIKSTFIFLGTVACAQVLSVSVLPVQLCIAEGPIEKAEPDVCIANGERQR